MTDELLGAAILLSVGCSIAWWRGHRSPHLVYGIAAGCLLHGILRGIGWVAVLDGVLVAFWWQRGREVEAKRSEEAET